VIGRLEGGALAPESGNDEIYAAMVQDTALVDLINAVQMHYTDTEVSATALPGADANLYPGEIRKCDMARLYRFSNTLYKLRMTGAQLKRFMEWTADFYNTLGPGEATVSLNERFSAYNYYIFEGICYEVNLSREPGSRIERLTWPAGNEFKPRNDSVMAA